MINKNEIRNDSLTIQLKDGRQLRFAEYGDPNGKPIFFFHGIGGGSRYEKLIPNAKLYFFEHEGHLSLLINKGEDILRSVCL